MVNIFRVDEYSQGGFKERTEGGEVLSCSTRWTRSLLPVCHTTTNLSDEAITKAREDQGPKGKGKEQKNLPRSDGQHVATSPLSSPALDKIIRMNAVDTFNL